MSIHQSAHPLAGKEVVIASGKLSGQSFLVEDWWDRIAGKSWMDCDGNPACLAYAIRSALESHPINNAVVYGKIGNSGLLVHVTELPERATS